MWLLGEKKGKEFLKKEVPDLNMLFLLIQVIYLHERISKLPDLGFFFSCIQYIQEEIYLLTFGTGIICYQIPYCLIFVKS